MRVAIVPRSAHNLGVVQRGSQRVVRQAAAGISGLPGSQHQVLLGKAGVPGASEGSVEINERRVLRVCQSQHVPLSGRTNCLKQYVPFEILGSLRTECV